MAALSPGSISPSGFRTCVNATIHQMCKCTQSDFLEYVYDDNNDDGRTTYNPVVLPKDSESKARSYLKHRVVVALCLQYLQWCRVYLILDGQSSSVVQLVHLNRKSLHHKTILGPNFFSLMISVTSFSKRSFWPMS